MKIMKQTKKEKFEESYFKGWYKNAVGNFSKKDLEISKNWFYSWLKKLNQYVPVQKGNEKKVLEIGCSIGAVSNILLSRGFDVWATDISAYAVKNAKKLTPKAHFSVVDIQKRITIKEKFDLIICFEVVEHLEKPEVGIKNMVEKLKAGGQLVISTPFPYSWNYHDPTHINLKTPEKWVKIMKKSGLKNVSYHRFTLIPFFYRFNKNFQIIIPFYIALPYVNSPIFFIGSR
jgi:2-polyprenyl-3-methyl-5-hydroxy-6-metoxy-1,4-benzoquinol methylase